MKLMESLAAGDKATQHALKNLGLIGSSQDQKGSFKAILNSLDIDLKVDAAVGLDEPSELVASTQVPLMEEDKAEKDTNNQISVPAVVKAPTQAKIQVVPELEAGVANVVAANPNGILVEEPKTGQIVKQTASIRTPEMVLSSEQSVIPLSKSITTKRILFDYVAPVKAPMEGKIQMPIEGTIKAPPEAVDQVEPNREAVIPKNITTNSSGILNEQAKVNHIVTDVVTKTQLKKSQSVEPNKEMNSVPETLKRLSKITEPLQMNTEVHRFTMGKVDHMTTIVHPNVAVNLDAKKPGSNFDFERSIDEVIAQQMPSVHKANELVNTPEIRRSSGPVFLQQIQKIIEQKELNQGIWSKHSFALEDGQQVQLSTRKVNGQLHIKVLAAQIELQRILVQQSAPIKELLQEEYNIDVSFEFGEQSSFSGEKSSGNDENLGPVSSSLYRSKNVVEEVEIATDSLQERKTLGFNNNEWRV